MPELPEVETIRLQLNRFIKGLKIAKVEVLAKKSFQGNPEQIIGKKVLGVSRRAKITLIELEGSIWLAIHLKLTGQLIYRQKQEECSLEPLEKKGPFAVKELPCKYTRVIISFDNGGRLYFNDLRRFGWIKVIKDMAEIGGEKLGPEAIDQQAFSLDYCKKILSGSKKPVKLLIMDQEKLAGVGNIYGNEALFVAGIDPRKPANSLSDKEAEKLRGAIIKVLKEAIKYKGTTDKDEAYRQISGQTGEYQSRLRVYGKAGESCLGCDSKIKRINLGGRGTFYCPTCQK
ncbi:MAG TPA: DNA-formamidopyrimidine glycosylase [Clostridia bacterium]|nr:DNA-formamidopyrimidine glycosylase [Clostridia bacterium]